MGAGHLLLFGALWLIAACLIGSIGRNRQIGFWPVFAVSLAVGPIIGTILALSSKRKYSLETLIKTQDAMFKQQYLHNQQTSYNRPNEPQLSVADELLKLKQLLDNDAITKMEYEEQKARILGR